MTRWLLNTFPTWALFILVVGGLMLIAAAGLVLVRRRWPHLSEGTHNDVAGVTIGLLVGVYGIVLAFVIVAIYEDFQAAKETVHEESTELAQLYRDSRAFPAPVREALDRAIGDYTHAVLGEEWELMADGKESARAWADIDDLYLTLQAYAPEGVVAETFYGEAVGKLNDLVGARRARLGHAQESLPATFQVLLVGGALLIIGFLYFFGMSSFRAQLLMILGVAGLIGFNLLLVIVLDHPFSGDITVPNEGFRQGALARFWP